METIARSKETSDVIFTIQASLIPLNIKFYSAPTLPESRSIMCILCLSSTIILALKLQLEVHVS